MRILFVHQNFPGQYKHLAPALAKRGHEMVALTMNKPAVQTGATVVVYGLKRGTTLGVHPWAEEFETKVLRGEAAAEAALQIKAQGFSPDVICAHPGWGESLFLKDVWPHAKQLSYLEYYYHFIGADVNFDPEFPEMDLATAARLRTKNAHNLLALETMDCGISPTYWQKAQFPTWARDRIAVVHDGVDTNMIAPNPAALIRSESTGLTFCPDDEILTFVNRNLEPCRGFHTFMRALPEIQRRRPRARVLIVGGEETGYGKPALNGLTWKQVYLQEVGSQLDLSRIYFLGQVPYQIFIALLQISTVHVYLTYPFVLSWSLLEAMSAGCLVVGSRTPPVEEVITHGSNGLLVDFFDFKALAETVSEALADRKAFLNVRQAARQSVIDGYDLHRVCLPRQIELVESLR